VIRASLTNNATLQQQWVQCQHPLTIQKAASKAVLEKEHKLCQTGGE
jgi:hypothetical protein